MVITEYRSLYSTNGNVKKYSWKEFCNKISHPVVSVGTTWERFISLPKTSDNYEDETQQEIKMKAGGAVFGEMFTSADVPPGRKKDNFRTRSAISLDYEHCNEGIYERIHSALEGYTYAYHTTCKHQPPHDCRLHVIIPFANDVDWKQYTLLAVEFSKKIGVDGLDESCLRRSQMMLYCVHLRGTEYKYYTHTADFLDAEKYLTEVYGTLDVEAIIKNFGASVCNTELKYITKKVKKERESVKKAAPRTDRRNYVFHPDESRAGDIRSCFNAVFSCRDILDTLPEYVPCGERYTYYKGSGAGGVWVSDDGIRCGSFHSDSGDPLYGRSLTAFDVFLLYKCDDCDTYRDKLLRAHKYAIAMRKTEYTRVFYLEKRMVLQKWKKKHCME